MGQVLSLYNDAPEIEPSGEVCFQNDGEIEINTIRLLGVSAKGECAIGFFGTGLKYAIAILLRENCAVTIYSGLQKLEFTKQTIKVRDKDFDAVFMNGEQLGFTTELGKTCVTMQRSDDFSTPSGSIYTEPTIYQESVR